MPKTSITGQGATDAVFASMQSAGYYQGASQEERDDAKAQLSVMLTALVDYIADNIEFSASLENSLTQLFGDPTALPAPSDGGTALKTAWTSLTQPGTYDSVDVEVV